MNIWYLSAHDQPKGQSSRTYDFSIELANRGHQVTMFTNSYCHWTHVERLTHHEKWRIEEIDGVRIIWLRTIHYTGNDLRRGMNMLSNVMRSIQVARTLSDKPDVVIGPSVPIGTGWSALRIAQMKGSAFVFEVRDIWPQALVDLGVLSNKSLPYRLFRYLEKYLYRKAVRISAVLPFAYKHIGNSGVDSNKVCWIPNGANLDKFSDFHVYDGGRFQLTAMYIGGFSSTHDISTIIKSAKIIEEKGLTRYRFIIVGSGQRRLDYENETNNLQVQNVEFRDSVPKSKIPQLQSHADVLLSCVKDTTVYQFGINSNKIFDYLASARPIIFSGNAPNDPIAESGAGFSIPPEDPDAMVEALQKILELTSEERIEMGKRGRHYVEKEFDMRMLSDRMESLLLQAIKEKES